MSWSLWQKIGVTPRDNSLHGCIAYKCASRRARESTLRAVAPVRIMDQPRAGCDLIGTIPPGDNDTAAARGPPPAGERQANLGAQDRGEETVDAGVHGEFALDLLIAVLTLTLTLPLKRLTIISGSRTEVKEVENSTSKPLRRNFASSSPRRYRRW